VWEGSPELIFGVFSLVAAAAIYTLPRDTNHKARGTGGAANERGAGGRRLGLPPLLQSRHGVSCLPDSCRSPCPALPTFSLPPRSACKTRWRS
jgi:hypothetical protein